MYVLVKFEGAFGLSQNLEANETQEAHGAYFGHKFQPGSKIIQKKIQERPSQTGGERVNPLKES
jgi:hypothetical protein